MKGSITSSVHALIVNASAQVFPSSLLPSGPVGGILSSAILVNPKPIVTPLLCFRLDSSSIGGTIAAIEPCRGIVAGHCRTASHQGT